MNMKTCSTPKSAEPKAEVMTLYHGTDYLSAMNILAKGLRDDTCLTSCEELANYYADARCEEIGESSDESVIVEIKVQLSSLRVDWPSYCEPIDIYRNEYADSNRDWAEMCESGEIPYPVDDKDVKPALEATRSVRTVGEIPRVFCSLQS